MGDNNNDLQCLLERTSYHDTINDFNCSQAAEKHPLLATSKITQVGLTLFANKKYILILSILNDIMEFCRVDADIARLFEAPNNLGSRPERVGIWVTTTVLSGR